MNDGTTVLEASIYIVALCSLILPASMLKLQTTISASWSARLVTLLGLTILTVGTACLGPTPAALQGTWFLEYYGAPGDLIAPYPARDMPLSSGTDITLTISDSEIEGSAGVNSYYGNARIIGDKLIITDAYTTELAGPDHLMEQEERYFSILGPEVMYQITDGKLTIYSGEEVLVFTKEIPDRDYGQSDVARWIDIAQVAVGGFHTIGLMSDSTVVAVGWNEFGQCEVGDWTGINQTAAGDYHTVGLKSDGTVLAVGDNHYRQLDVNDWTDIIEVAAGGYHTIGLKSDGTVLAVGPSHGPPPCFQPDFGQSDVDGWIDIIQVTAGALRTVGLKSAGTAVFAGLKMYEEGDVGDWTDIDQVAAGDGHTVGLKSDGTVVATGDNDHGQCNVSGWTHIVQIAAGSYHTVGLKSDGTVIATGKNDHGQCNVGGWTDIVEVAAGYLHTIGVKSDGTVVAAGVGV